MTVPKRNEPKISVLPLQKIFLKLKSEGLTTAEIAYRCDFIRGDGCGDGQSLQRVLGLYPYTDKNRHYFNEYVGHPIAIKILRGFSVDAVEVGI